MAKNRLIIVRRTENFAAEELEKFLSYLEKPAESTCLIFISSKTDFSRKFYKKIRTSGRAVKFSELRGGEIVPWIRRTAGDLGLKIDGQACDYLQQVMGNRLRDIHAELEKLYLRYGKITVGVEHVKELAVHSRIYTIFELMDLVSAKNCAESLIVLNRYLEEEDKVRGPLGVMGMLNRQLRLLWQTRAIMAKGGQKKDVAKKLGSAHFKANILMKQSERWSIKELERGLHLLYQADGLLKSSSRPRPVMENLILSLCG